MKDFLMNLYESVAAEEAHKRRIKRQAVEAIVEGALGPPVPAPPPVDPLLALDEHLRAIDVAHEEDAAAARRGYLELLARMAPARTGPAPAPDAHALAVAPSAGVPSPGEVLRTLRAAQKSRDDLRRDLRLWTRLRDLADLGAEKEAREAAEKAARAKHEAVVAEFEEVEIEWAGKIEVERRLEQEASQRAAATRDALYELEKAQGIADDMRQVRSPAVFGHSPPEVREEAARAQASVDALREKARRLGELERAFFPPPPPPPIPPGVTQYETPPTVTYRRRA